MSTKFQVKYLGQNISNNEVILSGTGFGYVDSDVPLWFEVAVAEFESPLMVSLAVKVDKNRSELFFDIGKIQDNQLALTFYNPSFVGASGLTAPVGLLVLGSDIIGFMFHIDRLPNSVCYRISYEFYHGLLDENPSLGEKP